MSCKFPCCKFHAQPNGYCIGHRSFAGGTDAVKSIPNPGRVIPAKVERVKAPAPVRVSTQRKASTPRKPIKKVSDKMKITKRELKKKYPPYLAKNPICNIQFEGCTIAATVVNHTQGRGVNEVLNEDTWEPSCTNCNHRIEIEHARAALLGHKKQRNTAIKRA